jgi:hypothetical protein
MALDPNNARAGIVGYLLGAGPITPMPPPTHQDLALARLHRALDGGAFEHPWNVNLPPQATHPWQIRALCKMPRFPFFLAVLLSIYHHIAGVEERHRHLDVHLPYGCGNRGKDDPPMVTILTFDIDHIPQRDFLSRVCATVGVEQAQSKLGWKTYDDKEAAYRCVATTDDIIPNIQRCVNQSELSACHHSEAFY